MNNFTVYEHINRIDGKRYFGITCKPKPEYRWANGKGYPANKHFTNAINKFGWDNFDHKIIMAGMSKEDACNLEQYLIAKYDTTNPVNGYNLSIGGECSGLGVKRSEESRKKQSEALKKVTRSDSWKKAISKGKKGKTNGLKGRTGDKSQKSGIVIQIDVENNKEINRYYGFAEMNRATGFAKTPVREAAYGIRKQAYGYLWKYQKRNA